MVFLSTFISDLMKYEITSGIVLAAILIASVAIANSDSITMPKEVHESHHNGNGMMNMQNMMNGDMEKMHEQCESSMTEEIHEQCETVMESSGCHMED